MPNAGRCSPGWPQRYSALMASSSELPYEDQQTIEPSDSSSWPIHHSGSLLSSWTRQRQRPEKQRMTMGASSSKLVRVGLWSAAT